MATHPDAVDKSVLLGASQSTMRAAVITRYGAHELKLAEVSQPTIETLEEGHVLVRVQLVALNPVDVKTRRGATPSVRGTPTRARPVVLGYDCSGEIVGIGPGVPAGWNIGDEVWSRVCSTTITDCGPIGCWFHSSAISHVYAGVMCAPNYNHIA
jgi:NADPH:quinone reductase-like Zn-dependent oxidoreductase